MLNVCRNGSSAKGLQKSAARVSFQINPPGRMSASQYRQVPRHRDYVPGGESNACSGQQRGEELITSRKRNSWLQIHHLATLKHSVEGCTSQRLNTLSVQTLFPTVPDLLEAPEMSALGCCSSAFVSTKHVLRKQVKNSLNNLLLYSSCCSCKPQGLADSPALQPPITFLLKWN